VDLHLLAACCCHQLVTLQLQCCCWLALGHGCCMEATFSPGRQRNLQMGLNGKAGLLAHCITELNFQSSKCLKHSCPEGTARLLFVSHSDCMRGFACSHTQLRHRNEQHVQG
jgi:hypothetical protein